MKIKPLYDRIVIEPTEEPSKTASGLYIPDVAKDKPKTGKVIAVGQGNYTETGHLIRPDTKINDTVIFNKNSVEEIKLDGKTYLIIKESDILGIIES